MGTGLTQIEGRQAVTAVSAQPPLVDVGVPTYGSGEYLAEAIEAVLGQTFTGWTLTVSENGPGSDEIARIVEPYLADPRVRYTAIGRNVGGAGNATSLIGTGSAPYVAILHDDDRWAPEFLARRVAFLEANPSSGLVFSPCDVVDGTGKVLFRFEVPLKEGVQEQRAFLRRLYRGNLNCVPTALVRRSSYEAVGPTFSESLLFYDYEMWFRIAARFDIGFLREVDASYRVHTTQTTQAVRLHIGDHRLALLREAERIVPPDFPRLEVRRGNCKALVRAARDAFARGERRRGLGYLVRAIRTHPAAPLDPDILLQAVRRLTRPQPQRELRQAGLTA
jgi:glycosyltransferase involved in cell wall biosynthesis